MKTFLAVLTTVAFICALLSLTRVSGYNRKANPKSGSTPTGDDLTHFYGKASVYVGLASLFLAMAFAFSEISQRID